MSEIVSLARGQGGGVDSVVDEYVTVVVHKQQIGIPVLTVQDVLGPQRLTRIPLAPTEVAGVLNLRGRVVTAIDLRRRLKLPPLPSHEKQMSVVVDNDGELYSLLVDAVGDVIQIPRGELEANPATLDRDWQEYSRGVHQLEDELLIILDVTRLLNIKGD